MYIEQTQGIPGVFLFFKQPGLGKKAFFYTVKNQFIFYVVLTGDTFVIGIWRTKITFFYFILINKKIWLQK